MIGLKGMAALYAATGSHFKRETRMGNNNNYSNINIRTTALEQFWGNKFENSIYLWAGAQHNLTLEEINALNTPTMDDFFASKEERSNAHKYCKDIHQKYLHILTDKLNEIHGINLPVSFWRTAFGLWLFRCICIAHEKYSYLSKIDIDNTDLKLLDTSSFYIPNDHYDFFYCFTNDFGVQQLVSHYYYLFKKSDFPSIPMECALINEQKDIAKNWKTGFMKYISMGKLLSLKVINYLTSKETISGTNPEIAMCSVYFGQETYTSLVNKSNGRIKNIDLPVININNASIDVAKRKKLLSMEAETEFEYYLMQTMFYCMPKMFIEYFMQYYSTFMKDIKNKQFAYIVSEGWISDIRASIYVALAQNLGRKLIGYEHCVFFNIYRSNALWIEYNTVDYYLTTGWTSETAHIISGGFSGRDINKYVFSEEKSDILFVSTCLPPYLIQYGDDSLSNSKYLKSLMMVSDFIDLLPESLYKYFILRPRREFYAWDTEHAWDVKKRNIRVDRGNYQESILNSKITVIDHMSTGLSEILLINAPVLIIYNEQIQHISEEYSKIFGDLIKCGVVHSSAQSAIAHLSIIYDDVQAWWNSSFVQASLNALTLKLLATSSKTEEYLLSLLKKDLTEGST
jgi:putative transferase (TIGR04331 family)